MSALAPHDPAVERNNLRHIKSIFTAPIFSGELEDDTPIFVVGMPRSGSTLVEQMLASHSEVTLMLDTNTCTHCQLTCIKHLAAWCVGLLKSTHPHVLPRYSLVILDSFLKESASAVGASKQ